MKRFNPTDLATSSSTYASILGEGQAYADFIAGEAIVGQHLLYQQDGKVYKENPNVIDARLMRSNARSSLAAAYTTRTNFLYEVQNESNLKLPSADTGGSSRNSDILSNGNIVTANMTPSWRQIISIFDPVTSTIVKEWDAALVPVNSGNRVGVRAHPNGGFIVVVIGGSDCLYATFDNNGNQLNSRSIYSQTPNNLGAGVHPTNSPQLFTAEPCGANWHMFLYAATSTGSYRFYKWTVAANGSLLTSNLSDLVNLPPGGDLTGEYGSGGGFLQVCPTRGQNELVILHKITSPVVSARFHAFREDGTAAVSNQGFLQSGTTWGWTEYDAVFAPLNNREFLVATQQGFYKLAYTLGGAFTWNASSNLFSSHNTNLMRQRHWASTLDGGIVIIHPGPQNADDIYLFKYGPTGSFEGSKGSAISIFGASGRNLTQNTTIEDAQVVSKGLTFVSGNYICFSAATSGSENKALLLDRNGNFIKWFPLNTASPLFTIDPYSSNFNTNVLNRSVFYSSAIDMSLIVVGGKVMYMNPDYSISSPNIIGVSVPGTNVAANASVKALTLGISELTNSSPSFKSLGAVGKNIQLLGNTVKISKSDRFL